jgi:transcription elongation factor Elf1
MAEKLSALKSGHWSDFSMTVNPICPHCGTEFDIRENEAWFVYDDNNTHTVECNRCENEFQVNSHARWSFSTDEQEDDDAN